MRDDLQTSTTITEALAETKTLVARIDKKRASIVTHLIRDARLKDPFEADGGSQEWVKRESQAIGDLNDRLVNIRCAIQKKNQETSVTVQGKTYTVAQWLTWRKEVAPGEKSFLGNIAQAIARAKKEPVVTRDNLRLTDKPTGAEGEVSINVSEKELAESIEEYEHILGDLDGKLSLINATTVISL